MLLGVKIQLRYLQTDSLCEINYAGETEDICYLMTLFVNGGVRYAAYVVAADYKSFFFFYVCGSVHHASIVLIIQQDATSK